MLLTTNIYYVHIALLSYIIVTLHFKCWKHHQTGVSYNLSYIHTTNLSLNIYETPTYCHPLLTKVSSSLTLTLETMLHTVM